MARSCFIYLSNATPKVGGLVNGFVLVQSTDANPVQVTDIQVYSGANSNSINIGKPSFGSGGGAGLDGTKATGVTVIAQNGSASFPFSISAFQPQVPGSAALPYKLNAVVTFSDGTIISSNNFPANVAVSGQTTGGSLAAATYFVKVTSTITIGSTTYESLPSAEVNTGALNGVNVNQFTATWLGVPGVVYRVYFGTTTGVEGNYFASAAGASSLNITTTAGQTAGSPPGSDTSVQMAVSPLV